MTTSNLKPDPFEGLTLLQARTLIMMRPTWSERWRISGIMSVEERRRVVRDILMERREEYLVWFHNACVIASIDREEDRFSWHERKLERQREIEQAHYLAEQKQMQQRRRREPKEKAEFYERKLNNGFTVAELRSRKEGERDYLDGIVSTFVQQQRTNSRGV